MVSDEAGEAHGAQSCAVLVLRSGGVGLSPREPVIIGAGEGGEGRGVERARSTCMGRQ